MKGARSCSAGSRAGGKTVEVHVEVDENCCVSRLVIGGDFFAFPGEVVDEAEEAGRGCCDSGCLVSRVRGVLERGSLVGVRVDDVVSLLAQCYLRLCGHG